MHILISILLALTALGFESDNFVSLCSVSVSPLSAVARIIVQTSIQFTGLVIVLHLVVMMVSCWL